MSEIILFGNDVMLNGSFVQRIMKRAVRDIAPQTGGGGFSKKALSLIKKQYIQPTQTVQPQNQILMPYNAFEPAEINLRVETFPQENERRFTRK